jgi:divalent metal cation (Fe/Co/Zn/Cd) transporter
MVIEAGVALFAAATAHSPALFAFGSDSIVELLSALVVLLPWFSNSIPDRLKNRLAGLLLILLAFVVAGTAVLSLVLHLSPDPSRAGLAITSAALLVMPALAFLKRREARRTGDVALSADAVQSATCAYIALFALVGLALNAIFHIAWFDSLAALAVVPLLIREGRSAIRGHACACC